MPLLSIHTNQSVTEDRQQALIKKASALVAQLLSKPERYVMVCMQHELPMIFAGNDDPCAYLELKSIGLPEDRTADISRALCELIVAEIDITGERIYIEFSNAARHLWGWNLSTF